MNEDNKTPERVEIKDSTQSCGIPYCWKEELWNEVEQAIQDDGAEIAKKEYYTKTPSLTEINKVYVEPFKNNLNINQLSEFAEYKKKAKEYYKVPPENDLCTFYIQGKGYRQRLETKANNSYYSKTPSLTKLSEIYLKEKPCNESVKEPLDEMHELSETCQPCSEFLQNSNKDSDLGYFENKYKKVVKVLRKKNKDGSISEEKQVITIRTEKKDPCIENNLKKINCESFGSNSLSSCSGSRRHIEDEAPLTCNEIQNDERLAETAKCYQPGDSTVRSFMSCYKDSNVVWSSDITPKISKNTKTKNEAVELYECGASPQTSIETVPEEENIVWSKLLSCHENCSAAHNTYSKSPQANTMCQLSNGNSFCTPEKSKKSLICTVCGNQIGSIETCNNLLFCKTCKESFVWTPQNRNNVDKSQELFPKTFTWIPKKSETTITCMPAENLVWTPKQNSCKICDKNKYCNAPKCESHNKHLIWSPKKQKRSDNSCKLCNNNIKRTPDATVSQISCKENLVWTPKRAKNISQSPCKITMCGDKIEHSPVTSKFLLSYDFCEGSFVCSPKCSATTLAFISDDENYIWTPKYISKENFKPDSINELRPCALCRIKEVIKRLEQAKDARQEYFAEMPSLNELCGMYVNAFRKEAFLKYYKAPEDNNLCDSYAKDLTPKDYIKNNNPYYSKTPSITNLCKLYTGKNSSASFNSYEAYLSKGQQSKNSRVKCDVPDVPVSQEQNKIDNSIESARNEYYVKYPSLTELVKIYLKGKSLHTYKTEYCNSSLKNDLCDLKGYEINSNNPYYTKTPSLSKLYNTYILKNLSNEIIRIPCIDEQLVSPQNYHTCSDASYHGTLPKRSEISFPDKKDCVCSNSLINYVNCKLNGKEDPNFAPDNIDVLWTNNQDDANRVWTKKSYTSCVNIPTKLTKCECRIYSKKSSSDKISQKPVTPKSSGSSFQSVNTVSLAMGTSTPDTKSHYLESGSIEEPTDTNKMSTSACMCQKPEGPCRMGSMKSSLNPKRQIVRIENVDNVDPANQSLNINASTCVCESSEDPCQGLNKSPKPTWNLFAIETRTPDAKSYMSQSSSTTHHSKKATIACACQNPEDPCQMALKKSNEKIVATETPTNNPKSYLDQSISTDPVTNQPMKTGNTCFCSDPCKMVSKMSPSKPTWKIVSVQKSKDTVDESTFSSTQSNPIESSTSCPNITNKKYEKTKHTSASTGACTIKIVIGNDQDVNKEDKKMPNQTSKSICSTCQNSFYQSSKSTSADSCTIKIVIGNDFDLRPSCRHKIKRKPSSKSDNSHNASIKSLKSQASSKSRYSSCKTCQGNDETDNELELEPCLYCRTVTTDDCCGSTYKSVSTGSDFGYASCATMSTASHLSQASGITSSRSDNVSTCRPDKVKASSSASCSQNRPSISFHGNRTKGRSTKNSSRSSWVSYSQCVHTQTLRSARYDVRPCLGKIPRKKTVLYCTCKSECGMKKPHRRPLKGCPSFYEDQYRFFRIW